MSLSPHYCNRLLASLSREDLALLAPSLAKTQLEQASFLEHAGAEIEEVYFLESGIVSMLTVNGSGRRLEINQIGYEGMTGLPVIMGVERSLSDAVVRFFGESYVISTAHLQEALRTSQSLRLSLLRYGHVFMIQASQAALANGCAKIPERLCRWLLMAADRMNDDNVHITHDQLSTMLGVRRPSISDAIASLEGDQLIGANRRHIKIRDRNGLAAIAKGFYGVSEDHYDRLFGVNLEAPSAHDEPT